MTKILLKKQLMEVFSWIYQDRRTGKKRSSGRAAGFALLYAFIFITLGITMYGMMHGICGPLVNAGMGWLYITVVGLMTLVFGMMGSIFMTYSSLYKAKDNDLLLSMPIPQGKILFARVFGVYIIGLMYELVMIVPGMISWFQAASLDVTGVIFSLLIPFVLSILVLALTAILGWLIALISGKLRGRNAKNMVSMILSLGMMAAYFALYQKAFSGLPELIANPGKAQNMKKTLYLFYQMGLAAQGKITSMVIFTGTTALLTYVVYLVMEKSFIRLNTADKGGSTRRKKAVAAESLSVSKALFLRELKRFAGSVNYMLNCGLSSIMMLIAAVFLIVKADMMVNLIKAMPSSVSSAIPLLATAAICFMATMNDTTAPSVSLEGKSLWILRSLPASGKDILMAKIKLQLVITAIPAAILVAAAEWVLKPGIAGGILMIIAVASFIVLMAAFGLFMGLKTPDFTWTNEVVPIKQSMSVMVTLFGGWGIVVALCVIGFLLSRIMSPVICLAVLCAAVIIADYAFMRWIMTKGVRIWDNL